MNLAILNEINRMAFLIGKSTNLQVMVDYYTGTDSVSVTIWETGDQSCREYLSGIYLKSEDILSRLSEILNRKELAA